MADPAGAALCAREALKSDGHCLLVEPMAGDHLADNLNPVGRLNYCTRAKMVKDLRTDYEVGKPAAVLDADIDGILEAAIRWSDRRDDE